MIDLDALFEAEGLGLSGDNMEGGGVEEIERRQVELYMARLRKVSPETDYLQYKYHSASAV